MISSKFISDKEIDLNQSDFLKTKVYADNLVNIINNSEKDKVFTIGLYGSWGSGKSSIIETAKKKIEKEKDQVKFITYDAWQYSNDSFRRMFLRCLSIELRYSKLNLKKLFYENESIDIKIKNKISPLKIALFVSSAVLLYFFIRAFFFEFNFKNNFEIISTLSLVSALSVLLLSFFNQFRTSVAKPYFFASEQFEEQFIDIVKDSFEDKKGFISKLKFWHRDTKNKLEKLIIVVDNIDRCSSDIAYQLLTDIKTFLGSQKFSIVFIIPVDDKALLKHFFSKDQNEIIYNDKEEFLRKIFNVTLRIKPYNATDMFTFTKSICNAGNLTFKNETINIIGQEYSKNPRRVIQLINNLIVELNNYDEIFSKDNEVIICCILIIREEYPSFYEEICENSTLLVNYLIKENEEALNRFMRIAHIEFNEATNEVINRVLLNSSNHFNNIPLELIEMINTFDKESLKKFLAENNTIDDDIYSFLNFKIDEAHDNKLKNNLPRYIELVNIINDIRAIPDIYLARVFEKFKSNLESIFQYSDNLIPLLKLVELENKKFGKYNLKTKLIDIISLNTNSTNTQLKERWVIILKDFILNITDATSAKNLKDNYERNYSELPKVDKLKENQFEEFVTKNFIKNRTQEIINSDLNNTSYRDLKYILSSFEDKSFVLDTLFSRFNSTDIQKNLKEERYQYALMFNDLIAFVNNLDIKYDGNFLIRNLEELFSEIDFFDDTLNLSKVDVFKTFDGDNEKLELLLTLLYNYYLFTENLQIIEEYLIKIDPYISESVREKIVKLLDKGENINFYLNRLYNSSNYSDENLVRLKKYYLTLNEENLTDDEKKSICYLVNHLLIWVEDEEYENKINEILEFALEKNQNNDLIFRGFNEFLVKKGSDFLEHISHKIKSSYAKEIEINNDNFFSNEKLLKYCFEVDDEILNNKIIGKLENLSFTIPSLNSLISKIIPLMVSMKKNKLTKLIAENILLKIDKSRINMNNRAKAITDLKKYIEIIKQFT